MNGIPFQITRDGELFTVHLATRLPGADGETMRQSKENYHAAKTRMSAALQRTVLYGVKATKVKDLAALESIMDKQEMAAGEVNQQKALAEQAAFDFVRMSIAGNHGETEADAIMACLTDSVINSLVSLIETGEAPEDFFGNPATPPSGSGTTPSAAAPSKSSSGTASPASNSKPAKSGSKTRTSSSPRKKG